MPDDSDQTRYPPSIQSQADAQAYAMSSPPPAGEQLNSTFQGPS